MRLGVISLMGDDVDAFRKEVSAAEEIGCDLIGIGDVPFAWQDMYAGLYVAAEVTKRARLSPMVTTPFLRHPVVSASAISAVDSLSGGRASFTLGGGGNIARGLGRLPASSQELKDYFLAVRSLLRGETVKWDGFETVAIRNPRPVPMHLSAYGPKSLRLAGEIADGVVLVTGGACDSIHHDLQIVRTSAEEAGRDPASIDAWAYSYISIRETRQAAIDDLKPLLSTTAAFRMRPKHKMDAVPPEYKEAVLELRRRYDTSDHVTVGSANSKLVDELGLAEYLAGQAGIVGTPDEVAQQLAAVAKSGISHLMCALPGNPDPLGTLERLGRSAALAGI